MGKFGNFKKVGCGTAHEASGKIFVKKSEALFFQMGKDVVAHIGFYFYAKIVSPVIYKPEGGVAQKVCYSHKGNYMEEKAHCSLWNYCSKQGTGCNWKGYID